MARLPSKNDLRQIDHYLGDISTKLDKITSTHNDWASSGEQTLRRHVDIAHELKQIEKLSVRRGELLDREVKRINELQREIVKMDGAWKAMGKTIAGNLGKAVDKLGKSIISMGLSTFELGLNKLHLALYKVYELTERWTNLMGEFKNRLGVTTKNIDVLGKTAAQVEGKIYGLTGAFGQGAPMVNDFVEGLGRIEDVVNSRNLAELVKTGAMASRVLGLAAGETGELTRTLQQLGEDTREQKDLFLDISAGAKAAGVSSAKFGKEIVQSKDFMASFGKEGRKTFVQMTAYANKLGVSLRTLEEFTKMTDTFDSTATSVAKLNTVFGTTVNSLQLMLEQDPSKRLETVRQALLEQGKTFDSLSRQERDFLAETLHMSREELAGVIRTGKSLTDVQKDQEKARAQQESSQRNMAKLVNKTATTLFSFGAAWDKVTRAVTKLVRPFTDVLGLTKAGGKDTKTFSQVMGGLFDKLTRFITDVAGNPAWQKFMKNLASDAVSLAKKIGEIATSPQLGEWIKTVTDGATKFYNMMKTAFGWVTATAEKMMPVLKFVLDHLQEILAAWAFFKGGSGVVNIARGVSGLVGQFGKASSAAGMASSAGAAGGMGVAGGALAVAGAGMAGFALGRWLDEKYGISDYLAGVRKFQMNENSKTAQSRVAAEMAQAKLNQAIVQRQELEKRTAEDMKKMSSLSELHSRANEQVLDITRSYGAELKRLGKSQVDVSSEDRKIILERARAFEKMGIGGKDLDRAITDLSTTGRLTKRDFEAINKATADYINVLRDAQQSAEILQKSAEARENFEFSRQKEQSDAAAKLVSDELKQREAQAKQLKEMTLVLSDRKDLEEAKKKGLLTNQEIFDNQSDLAKLSLIVQQKAANKAEQELQAAAKKKAEFQLQSEQAQLKHEKKLREIQLRSAIMMSEEFVQFRNGLRSGTSAQAAFEQFVRTDQARQTFGVGSSDFSGVASPVQVEPIRPMTFAEEAPGKRTNFAARKEKAAAGGSTTKVVAGDIYLDGKKVGRHVVRGLLSDGQGG